MYGAELGAEAIVAMARAAVHLQAAARTAEHEQRKGSLAGQLQAAAGEQSWQRWGRISETALLVRPCLGVALLYATAIEWAVRAHAQFGQD